MIVCEATLGVMKGALNKMYYYYYYYLRENSLTICNY